MANLPKMAERWTTVFSVPDRDFIAVVFAAGFMAEFASQGSAEELEPGEIVSVLEMRRPIAYKGRLEEISESEARVVYTRKEGVGPIIVTNLELLCPCYGKLTRKSQREFLELSEEDMAVAVLGLRNALWLRWSKRGGVAFVGPTRKLQEELHYPSFRRQSGGDESHYGCLGDFVPEQKPDGTSMIIGPRSSYATVVSMTEKHPSALIFDGFSGFQKWGHMFSSSHQVVVLDRSSKTFQDDFEEIESRYHHRISDVDNNIHWPDMSETGIELLSFVQ